MSTINYETNIIDSNSNGSTHKNVNHLSIDELFEVREHLAECYGPFSPNNNDFFNLDLDFI